MCAELRILVPRLASARWIQIHLSMPHPNNNKALKTSVNLMYRLLYFPKECYYKNFVLLNLFRRYLNRMSRTMHFCISTKQYLERWAVLHDYNNIVYRSKVWPLFSLFCCEFESAWKWKNVLIISFNGINISYNLCLQYIFSLTIVSKI